MSFHFQYTPTGYLSSSPNTQLDLYSFELCAGAGWLRNKTTLITPKRSGLVQTQSTRSIEPEDHLDNVADNIAREQHSIKRILCFSYKDVTLANRICHRLPHASKPYIVFEGNPGEPDSFPDAYNDEAIFGKLLAVSEAFDLILIRHYLEHSEDPVSLLEALCNSLSRNGTLYVEVPSTDKFILAGNPLFLWEQHKHYFTNQSFHRLVELAPLQVSKTYVYGNDIEPSICSVLKKPVNPSVAFEGYDCGTSKESDTVYLSELKSGFEAYIRRWRELFDRYKHAPKVCIGFGHNLDRFLQLIDRKHDISAFYDSDLNKHGLYPTESEIPIDRIPKKFHESMMVLLGVHDRSTRRVMTAIRKISPPQMPVYSIFDNLR